MTTAKKRLPFSRGNQNFVNTTALNTYKEKYKLTGQQIADSLSGKLEIPVTESMVLRWTMRRRIPRAVVKALDLQTRGGARVAGARKAAAPTAKGEIYLAYVSAEQDAAFKAFTAALNINVKTVL